MKKSGFTLIELLIVIAIIALLAAILFPVFNSARARGREAVCKSNLHQILLASNLYSQDYDGQFTGPGWDTGLMPYVKSPQVYDCPGNASHHRATIGNPPVIIARGDYVYNGLLGPTYDEFAYLSVVYLSEVRHPGQTVWFGEGDHDAHAEAATNVPCGPPGQLSPLGFFCSAPHLGGTNIGFVDGHVKHYPKDRLNSLTRQQTLIFLPKL